MNVSVILTTCIVVLFFQCIDAQVECAIGVTWYYGSIYLEDLSTGSQTALYTSSTNFNGLTRDEDSGIFYINGQSALWTYDPCTGNGVTSLGSVSGLSGNSMRAIGYNSDDGLLYVFDDNGVTDYLHSVNLNTLSATLIGSTGLPTIQGAEFDEKGRLYAWTVTYGLVVVSTSDASVTVISTSNPSLNLQYLAFDPDNNNILYGSDQSTIYKISKSDGSLTATTFNDNAYRGLYILDQDSCSTVDDCPGTEEPVTTDPPTSYDTTVGDPPTPGPSTYTTANSGTTDTCAIGVTWYYGSVYLEDLSSGTRTALYTSSTNFNGLTRDEDSGIFYINGQSALWTFDPCTGNGVTSLGSVSGLNGNSMRAIAYNSNDGLLYVFDDNGVTDYLHSVNLNTLSATLIGSTGLPTIQGAEFDEKGRLYAWTVTYGLVVVSTSDASVIVISTTNPSLNLQYLAFDPDNNDVIYGSDQSTIYKISKSDGSLTATTLNDNAYRGLYILDQEKCNAVEDCPGTEEPVTTDTPPATTSYDTTTTDEDVACGVGVHWYGGEIVLEDVISGSTIDVYANSAVNFNALARDSGPNGAFYIPGSAGVSGSAQLYKYNGCSNTVTQVGSIGVPSGYTARGLGFNPKDELLYGVFSLTSTTSDDWLYSIDPDTLVTTYIGNTGETSLQCAEFDNDGILYSWSQSKGLITISTSDASVTQVSTSTSSFIFQFLTFDPDDNDIIYASDQSIIYKIDKTDGSLSATSWNDNAYRGFVLLDQDTCNSVVCDDTTTTAPDTTEMPSNSPTDKPTNSPTEKPTTSPTEKPTPFPTEKPTESPTKQPTEQPTERPTSSPTEQPTPCPECVCENANGGSSGSNNGNNGNNGSNSSSSAASTTIDSESTDAFTSHKLFWPFFSIIIILAILLCISVYFNIVQYKKNKSNNKVADMAVAASPQIGAHGNGNHLNKVNSGSIVGGTVVTSRGHDGDNIGDDAYDELEYGDAEALAIAQAEEETQGYVETGEPLGIHVVLNDGENIDQGGGDIAMIQLPGVPQPESANILLNNKTTQGDNEKDDEDDDSDDNDNDSDIALPQEGGSDYVTGQSKF